MKSLTRQRKRKTVQAKEHQCLPGETLCKAGTFVSHVKVLRESGTPRKRIYEVVVIEAGESLNRRFYPDETLQTAVPLFDGKSVHAFRFNDNELNHLPEILRDQTPIGGPLGNKVGTLKKPYWCPDKRAVIAELHVPVNDSTRWFLDMATSSLDLQEPQFGFSIDGQGEAFPKKVRGKVVEWVDSLTDIFSLDVVSNPAAGGRLLAQAIVENVVGDPRKRLLQYEMRSRERGFNRRSRPQSRPKQRHLRSRGNLNEGVNMKFRSSRPVDTSRAQILPKRDHDAMSELIIHALELWQRALDLIDVELLIEDEKGKPRKVRTWARALRTIIDEPGAPLRPSEALEEIENAHPLQNSVISTQFNIHVQSYEDKHEALTRILEHGLQMAEAALNLIGADISLRYQENDYSPDQFARLIQSGALWRDSEAS